MTTLLPNLWGFNLFSTTNSDPRCSGPSSILTRTLLCCYYSAFTSSYSIMCSILSNSMRSSRIELFICLSDLLAVEFLASSFAHYWLFLSDAWVSGMCWNYGSMWSFFWLELSASKIKSANLVFLCSEVLLLSPCTVSYSGASIVLWSSCTLSWLILCSRYAMFECGCSHWILWPDIFRVDSCPRRVSCSRYAARTLCWVLADCWPPLPRLLAIGSAIASFPPTSAFFLFSSSDLTLALRCGWSVLSTYSLIAIEPICCLYLRLVETGFCLAR